MTASPWIPAVVLAAAIAALPAGASAQQGLPPVPFAVGEPFPNVALPGLDGAPASIADFRGHKLILHIFASW
jgi:hypothetical protein